MRIRAVLFALVVLVMSTASFGQLRISVGFGPPAIPVYEQPPCPQDGYIWTPGYWAWSDDDGDYYWVPGTWVPAPETGYLWTPPYWAWNDGAFVFYDGYWGPHIGFYGGINYGFGYFGDGFEGGRWDNGHFFYNRSVTNVNVTIVHNVYNTTVVNRSETRVSYNGGNGGISARPTPNKSQLCTSVISPLQPFRSSTCRLLAEIENCGPQQIRGSRQSPRQPEQESLTAVKPYRLARPELLIIRLPIAEPLNLEEARTVPIAKLLSRAQETTKLAPPPLAT